MKSKKVCKKCMEEHTLHGWSPQRETDWKLGVVFCPVGVKCHSVGISYLVEYPPPPGCPYDFEHALAAGATNAV